MAHVLLPCDMPNWEEVREHLNQVRFVQDAKHLVDIMQKLHDICGLSLDPDDIPKRNDTTRFSYLQSYIDEELSPERRDRLLRDIIPSLAHAALQLKSLKPEKGFFYSLPQEGNVFVLNKGFVASMLAHAFFSTFPKRTEKSHPTLRDFNFGEFFRHLHQKSQQEKLWHFLSYFDKLSSSDYKGSVSIFRQVLPQKAILNLPAWLCCDRPLCSAFVRKLGTVNDAEPQLYKLCCCSRRIGGSVLEDGTTQESLFLCHIPELLILLSFIEAIDDNEALLVQGAEQINKFGTSSEDEPMVEVDVCLLDAFDFSNCPIQQYEDYFLLRELTKAMAAFRQPHRTRRPSPVGKSSSSSACPESRDSLSDSLQEEAHKCTENNIKNIHCEQLFDCATLNGKQTDIQNNGTGFVQRISDAKNHDSSVTSNSLKSQRSLISDYSSSPAGSSSLENYESPLSTGSSRDDGSLSYERLESFENNETPHLPEPGKGLKSLIGCIFSPLSSDSLLGSANERSCSMSDSEKGLTMLIDKRALIGKHHSLITGTSNISDKQKDELKCCEQVQDICTEETQKNNISTLASNTEAEQLKLISRTSADSGNSCEGLELNNSSMFFTPPSTLTRPGRKQSILPGICDLIQTERRESSGSNVSQQRPLQLNKQMTSPSSNASSEGAPSNEARDQLAPLVPIGSLSRSRPRTQSSADDEFFTPSESFEDDPRSGVALVAGEPPGGVTARLLREAIIRGLRKSAEKQPSTSDSSQGEPYAKRQEDSADLIRDDEKDTTQSHVSRCDSAGFVLDSDFDNSSLNLSIHERYEDFRRRIRRRSRRLSKRSSRSSARQSSSGSSDMDDIIEDPEMGFTSMLEPVPIRPSSSEPSLVSLSTSPEPALPAPPISILPDFLSVNKCKKLMVTTANGQLKAYSYDGVNPNLPVPFKAKFRCKNDECVSDRDAYTDIGTWEDVYTAAAAACAAAVVAASEGTSVMESAEDFESMTEDKENEQSSSAESEKKCDSQTNISYNSNDCSHLLQTQDGIRGIATGRWGDEKLCGDVQMKSVILWLAASMVGLPSIIFYTEGDKSLDMMSMVVKRAKTSQWSIGDLACELLRYCRNRVANYSYGSKDDARELPQPTLFNQLLSGDQSFISNDSLD